MVGITKARVVSWGKGRLVFCAWLVSQLVGFPGADVYSAALIRKMCEVVGRRVLKVTYDRVRLEVVLFQGRWQQWVLLYGFCCCC